MDPAVIVTLLVSAAGVIFASITAPLILARRTERMHREDQLADYRRQDAVAKAAADTTLAASVAALAAQTAAIGAHDAAVETGAKLDGLGVQTARIHTLVNSEMTAARQAQLDEAEQVIVMLRRVIALTTDKGLPADAADIETLRQAVNRRDQLEAILAERMRQFHLAEAEAEASPAGRAMLKAEDDKGEASKP
jgi:hypothetical protein